MTQEQKAQSIKDHEKLSIEPMERTAPPEPVSVFEPSDRPAPMVFDAPHSGRHYPEDFGHVADIELLKGGEDRFVDELFADAPDHGATYVVANFARTYIDPNRRLSDIDTVLLDGDWHETPEPTIMSERGVGLVFRLIGNGTSIYDRRLSAADITNRIENYWRPYHECLAAMIDRTAARFGVCYHLDCHSMMPVGNELAPDPGQDRADFVLGDLDGTTCEPGFTRLVAGTLEALGYSVAVNDPYKGALIVERYGAPDKGVHSLQIEINRKLYMDLETLERSAGFEPLRADLAKLAAAVADYSAASASSIGT
ncbi:MAG: N-formylglutamate amidohydrolase [Aliihoeflea sp.]|uniref:N-formylglutamate amidohydrolase n=1 Tax=Aliihoeflea sp. TaxID=2608088 RepID=UPI00403326AA